MMHNSAAYVANLPAYASGAVPPAPEELRLCSLGWNILRHSELDSTNREAARLLARGTLADKTVIVADGQSAGQGRSSRIWESSTGMGLWMSAIRHIPLPPERLPQSTLVLAVAVTEVLALCAGRTPKIKWPNDLLFDGRKCCGLLVETGSSPATDGAVPLIMGIGLNLYQQEEDFPKPLQGKAISLSQACGRAPDKQRLLQAILASLDNWLRRWIIDGLDEVREVWLRHNDTLGRSMTVPGENEALCGIACGLDTDGPLLVRMPDNGIRRIDSGEIRFLDADAGSDASGCLLR